MEDIDNKLEEKPKDERKIHFYQYLITGVFTLQFCCSHFVNYCFPYLERVPDVLTSLGTEEQLTYDICKNKEITYDIILTTIDSSIVNDFGIYCNKTKIYFISICFYFGIMVGAFISYLFIDKIGSKLTILIFTPIYFILLCLFKFLKPSYSENCLYGIYVFLFLLGFADFIVIIALLIYICEIVIPPKIPVFVITICIGISLSGLLNCIIFHASDLDWRNVFLIFAGINLVVYIIMFIVVMLNPIVPWNNDIDEDIQNSTLKELESDINSEPQVDNLNNTNVYNGDVIPNLNNNNNDLNNENINLYINYNLKNTDNKNTIHNQNLLHEKKNEKKNNIITETNERMNTENNSNAIITTDQNKILDNKLKPKEVDLLVEKKKLEEEEENKTHKKEKDFTPLDLILFSSQRIYYLILCFLWIINVILRNGIDLANKYVNHNIDKLLYPLLNYIIDIILSLFLLLIIKIYRRAAFHTMLVSLQILNFITFLFITYFIAKNNKTCINVFFLISKIFCHGLYSLLYVIICTIYPILIRTKGLGCNVAASCIGAFITCILVENLAQTTLILYFMVFEFFSMMMTYSLPKKIGKEILDSDSIKKNKDDLIVGNIIRIDEEIQRKQTKVENKEAEAVEVKKDK